MGDFSTSNDNSNEVDETDENPSPGNKDADNDNVSPDSTNIGLKRQVGFLGLVTFLVGSIIGAGIFASPAVVAKYAGSTGVLMITWVAGGIIAVLGALTYCELALMFPEACGNEYSYIYKALGNFPAFVVSYLEVLAGPLGMATIAIVAGDYVMTAITGHGNSVYSKVIAAAVILVNMFLNCYSVKWIEKVQILFTSAKMIPVAILVVTGLVRIGQGHTDNFRDAFNGSSTSAADITFALYGGLYSYGGWDTLNYVVAETVNPTRYIPTAIAIGIPVVTVCYIMVNIAYLTIKTPLQIAASNAIAVNIARELYGVMHWIIPALVACSVYGACNASTYRKSRLIYDASNRRHLPLLLGSVHLTRHTPIPAIVFSSVLACFMLIPRTATFKSLLNSLIFFDWTKTLMVVIAFLWMRRSKPHLNRPFKVFILIPILLLFVAVGVVVVPFVRYPVQQSIGLGIMLPAVPLYFAFIRYQIVPQTWMRKLGLLTKKIQLIGNLGSPEYEEREDDLASDESINLADI